MNADSLTAALDAYRGEHSGARFRANLVRRRVLAGMSQKRERRARLVRFAVPIAATFLASAALAATDAGRQRVQQLFDRVESLFSGSVPAYSPRAQPLRKRDAVSEAREAAPSSSAREQSAVDAPAPVVSVDELPLTPRGGTPSEVRPNRTVRQAAPRVAPPPSRDLAAYRRAHELHFHGADPEAALRAWNAYLTDFPAGTFVPEARLNRAVALARLGKRRDAERALDDIASDASDDYGRTRANSLREAFEDRYRL